MMEASDVSLKRTMNWVTREGMMFRMAWGRMTWHIVWMIVQTRGRCRIDLPPRNRLNAGPDDLTDVGAFKQNKGGQGNPVLRDRTSKDDRDEKPEPEDDHHERNAAHELDIDRRRIVNPAPLGETAKSEDDPDARNPRRMAGMASRSVPPPNLPIPISPWRIKNLALEKITVQSTISAPPSRPGR